MKLVGAARTTLEYDAADQLTRMLPTTGAPTTCSFDALGNLHTEWTGAQGTTYTWDTANRLTHIDLPDGTHEDNRYRTDGLRDWHYGPTGETYYTWDEGQVLLEKASSFVPQAIYTVAPPDGEAASPGGVISYKRGADHLYLVPDLQGHSRQRTTSTGTVESLMICDAWGSEVYGIGGAYLYLRAFGQHGYWRDTASRLYVEQRHLRTDLGLWLSVDPVEGEPAYLYVGDRPLWAEDPSGERTGGDRRALSDDELERAFYAKYLAVDHYLGIAHGRFAEALSFVPAGERHRYIGHLRGGERVAMLRKAYELATRPQQELRRKVYLSMLQVLGQASTMPRKGRDAALAILRGYLPTVATGVSSGGMAYPVTSFIDFIGRRDTSNAHDNGWREEVAQLDDQSRMSLAMVLGRGLLGPDGEAKRNEANLHASAPQQAWHGVLNQGWALGSDATTYLMAGAMKPLGATPQSLLAQRALRAVQFSVSAAFGAQAMQGIASALSDRSRPVPERTVEALLGAIFVVVAARGVREAARPGSARQHGLRPGGAMPSAGSHPSASGPVDPLLDTSVLSPIIEGDVQALVFAGRNVGNLSVTETGLLQALSRSSQGGTPVPELWEGVRARYRIRVMEDPSPALAQTVLRDIEMARGTKLTGAGRLADVTIIAEARREGLPLVTGDKSQFKDARAIGLTVRYRYFERSPAERLLAIHRIRKYIVEVIGDSPHTYTGSPTRMR